MPLDPLVAEALALARASGRRRFAAVTVPEARAFADEDAVQRPPGPAVAEVRALAVPGPAGPLRARLYRPKAGTLPLVVYFHGGGFVLCGLDSHDAICRTIAARGGVGVLSVDYRLAPEHRFPAAADDALAATRWAAEAASALGFDSNRLVVAGDSAGANLAAVTTLRLRDEGGPRLAGQILAYPVVAHAGAGFASYREFAEGYGLTADDMRWFWDHYAPDPALRTHPHAAPLSADSLKGLPPAFLFTAEYDVLRDEGEAYAARLAEAGGLSLFERVAGLHHGFLHMGGHPVVSRVFSAMAEWLARLAA
ncbi:alpha/beta hydrolase [Chthonobacter rhizosphaerae]|uniref:alpha/beta hydrolase n=1 Tax=Chthonobacter rhizosphaerae TaxID=2735553 RepID=UPI0015EEECBC|nr:alpha/beta hydrolase [Chthonobacter rhizosphaerae]